jgi:LysR family transcriptional regulator, hydrogen peroxide-inducible genes activator
MALPTLRQLGYLVSLADHKHFGRAARACHATQSTLSAGIQELERLLGAPLVERTKRRVMLTPLGEDVTARARRVLTDAQGIVEAAEASEPLAGPLRLGVIPTIAPFLLPRALARVRKAHPALRLILREDLTDSLLARLSAGELDAALIALPWPLEGLESLDLGFDPFLFVAPADHPLAKRASLREVDIPSDELLLLEEGHCLREHAMAACRMVRAEGRVLATSLQTLVPMVASRLGVSLLPKMAVDAGILSGTGLVARPLADKKAGRTIALSWRASSPRKPAFRTLGEHFRLPN